MAASVLAFGSSLVAGVQPGLGQPARPEVRLPTMPDAPAEVDLAGLVPQVRAGFRAEALRQRQRAVPVVVVVPDAGSYVRAIGGWEPLRRYPVLIDDGTVGASEDIARFVRAYGPERVVRWSSPERPDVGVAGSVERAVRETVLGVWGAGEGDWAGLVDAVRMVCGAEPPGAVVASGADPAWTAALALGAGRGQPVVWVEARRGVSDAMTREEGEELAASIERALGEAGLAWDRLGDTTDVVALCLNTPSRIANAPGQWYATTDRIGRLVNHPAETGRWGWSSQVHGTEAQAAYRAMSALFLPLSTAWLYDGYGSGQPWESYALVMAARAFGGVPGLEQSITHHPNNRLEVWRGGTARPVSATLVMVNTHGMRDFFELPGGTARSGDVPLLDRPAAVHFIHSWSAHQPGERSTIAGRWFERGAFAYCGSVQEPYLSAFVPPAMLASRMLSLAPWGIACRVDAAPVWRVAIFGDPLITLGPAMERCEEPFSLDGEVPVEDEMREALREGRMAAAIRALALCGRDADAARLVSGLRAGGGITPEVARAALGPLIRQGRYEDFQGVYPRLVAADASDPVHRDMLWFSARGLVPRDGSAMALLRPHIRPDQAASDTAELAMIATAGGQRSEAISMLTEYRATLTDAAAIRTIDAAMSRIRGR